jgi:hypothetical protein
MSDLVPLEGGFEQWLSEWSNARQRAGLSVSAQAREIGVDPKTLRNWLGGSVRYVRAGHADRVLLQAGLVSSMIIDADAYRRGHDHRDERGRYGRLDGGAGID